MLKVRIFDRLTRKQTTIIAQMELDVSPVKEIVSTMNHLDEILTEYEDHDWCDSPDYKKYRRVFYQNVKSLMVLSRCSAFIFDKR